jgi:hypothetical protein
VAMCTYLMSGSSEMPISSAYSASVLVTGHGECFARRLAHEMPAPVRDVARSERRAVSALSARVAPEGSPARSAARKRDAAAFGIVGGVGRPLGEGLTASSTCGTPRPMLDPASARAWFSEACLRQSLTVRGAPAWLKAH